MTDTNDSNSPPARPLDPTDSPPNEPFAFAARADEPAPRQGGKGSLLFLWVIVIMVALAVGIGAFALNRKLDRLTAKFVALGRTSEVRDARWHTEIDETLTRVREIDTQFAQIEGKLSDTDNAQQALQQQYADLARNRDDWVFAEVGQMLSSASEQLQLTGNTRLALFALESADTRVAALSGPQALAVRRAIARDIDKLKAAPMTDLTGLAIKLDNAIEQIDTLPLLGEAPPVPAVASPTAAAHPPAATRAAASAAVADESRWMRGWREFSTGLIQQLKGLVEVRRIDNDQTMLNIPEQAFFVRENVRLRLLSARLALLSRDPVTLASDLHAADAALARYFDDTSKRTQMVRELIKAVDRSSVAVAVPNLDASLQAVRNYTSGG